MTKREAFKVGFLCKVAELGMTPAEFNTIIDKQAQAGPIAKLIGGLGGVVGAAGKGAIGAISELSPYALMAMVGLPVAGGIMTGWGHSHLKDVSEEDVERMKIRDVVNTYRSEASRIRRKLHRDKWRKRLTQT